MHHSRSCLLLHKFSLCVFFPLLLRLVVIGFSAHLNAGWSGLEILNLHLQRPFFQKNYTGLWWIYLLGDHHLILHIHFYNEQLPVWSCPKNKTERLYEVKKILYVYRQEFVVFALWLQLAMADDLIVPTRPKVGYWQSSLDRMHPCTSLHQMLSLHAS